jgi:DNA-binding transcriptional MocR family regulator
MGARPVIDGITRVRFDMGVSPWTTRVLADFCESGSFDEHVSRMIAVYRRKRDAMLAALEERCAKFGRWGVPEGGFFIWVELAKGVDPNRLYDAAGREGIGYFGGRAFFDGVSTAEMEGENFIRLVYSHVSERDIPEAVMRLGRAMERAAL